MGRRGPPPKPTALKELAGNPGKRPLNPNEPKPAVRRPKMPKHLSEGGRREWRRVSRLLLELRVLTEADADILAMYCDTYDRWVTASQQLQARGMVVYTDKGYPVQSPYFAIVNKSLATMRQCLQELGLTPSSRSRLTSPEQAEDDEGYFGF